MPIIGTDVDVVDEAAQAALPTATDTVYLLSTDALAPAAATLFSSAAAVSNALPAAAALIAQADTLFNEGAQRVVVAKQPATITAAALTALFSPEAGPGQFVAPALVASADIIVAAAWAFDTNRFYIANPASSAADSAITTLADAVIASGKGRNTFLAVDYGLIPDAASGTRTVPVSLGVAGILARNDITYLNPNLEPAGVQGAFRYIASVMGERTATQRELLAAHQANTARTVGDQLRNYGSAVLADRTKLPQWRYVGGSRVVMDIRAHASTVSEDIVFGQIDAQGTLEAKWNGLITRRLLELYRLGALYGATPLDAFKVDTSRVVNPITDLANGQVSALVTLKTSLVAESLTVLISRRPVTASV